MIPACPATTGQAGFAGVKQPLTTLRFTLDHLEAAFEV
jgi:hypothetical protein